MPDSPDDDQRPDDPADRPADDSPGSGEPTPRDGSPDGSGAGTGPGAGEDPMAALFEQLKGSFGPGAAGTGGPNPAGFGAPQRSTGGTPPGGGLPGGFPGLGALGDLGALGGAGGGMDPAALFEQLSKDPAAMAQVMASVQQMMAGSSDGGVNWQVAHDLARQAAVTGGDPSVGERARKDVTEALRLADLWLDAVTDMPAAPARPEAWSRSEWVEATLDTWKRIVEPVATSVSAAMADAMEQQAPPELRPMMAGAGALMRSVGGSVFGMQLGQAVGGLAREVVSVTDVGLPLTAHPVTALVPANVDAFAEGLEVPVDEVRLYLAVREVAHARLFAHVPWLSGHLFGAVEQFARGIVIDTSRIEDAIGRVDVSDPAALQEALSSGMFEPERTPTQEAALLRLETVLALVEGWVDELVDAAAGPHLPHASALREAVRRRRAAGGPAEAAMASLVGLELRPRRLRDAARLWSVLSAASGPEGRDAVWDHPDLLPGHGDLDDPDGYATRRSAAATADADVDEALARMLDEGSADGDGGAGGGPGGTPAP